MNKLYAFLALVFLTACGSPGVDGTWNSVTDVDGMNFEIVMTGDVAKITQSSSTDETAMTIQCDVESLSEAKSKLICPEPVEGTITVSVDGDNMTAVQEGYDDEALNLVRN
tara:strand:- start:557 stop:889 length:333 start_codon:yes stop_codon:yes gene_type:complete